MATSTSKPELIVIVGPTASGKSELAMRLARRFNGEIISADSRQIYCGMDIGTGKPTKEEMSEIQHHLIDILNPDQFFSAAEYKRRALSSIRSIQKRGKLPMLVGGSGLYVDSILFDFDFNDKPDLEKRKKLNEMSIEELHQEIKKMKLTPPLNYMNKRHLIRTIETGGKRPPSKKMRGQTFVVGIDPGREPLIRLISRRNKQMIEHGLEKEVRNLAEKYGVNAQALDAIGYREWRDYFAEKCDLEDVRKKITQSSILYAKRQRTWFRRNKNILWHTDIKSAEHTVDRVMNT